MVKKKNLWLLSLLAAILLLCLACSGIGNNGQTNETDPNQIGGTEEISIVTPEPEQFREELNAILLRTTMLDGVTINGVNVGGMTREDAKAAVLPTIDAMSKELHVDVSIGDAVETFSGETIATESNLDLAIIDAFNLVREDAGFDAVMKEVERIKTEGLNFPVRVTFNETALTNAVNTFADAHDVAPVDAAVGYNKEKNKIDFTPDVPGRKVDREALITALLDAEGGETLEAPVEELPAEVTLDEIQSKYVLRHDYTTNFSKSIKNRKYNIKKGAEMITGTILHPGEVFSANDTLGVRNKANGWKIATAYVAGAHEKQYGGGVCQLSSTLYNAAVLSDMEIVERRNHSMPVDYVHKGRDATINSIGNLIDFKFRNSSKSDIIIIAYVDNEDYTKAGKLTMEIWGIPISEDSDGAYDEIRIPDPVKTKTLKPTGLTEERIDETKKPGYRECIVKNQNGSEWKSVKEYYLNGVLVKSEPLATSTYKAFAAVYIVGPPATADDTPEPTPSHGGSSDPTPTPTHDDPTDPPSHDDPTDPPTDPPSHDDPTDPPDDPPDDPPHSDVGD